MSEFLQENNPWIRDDRLAARAPASIQVDTPPYRSPGAGTSRESPGGSR